MRRLAIPVLVLALAVPALAAGESAIKGGYVMTKGSLPYATWVIIQESNYFVGDRVSFGYEIQFSYYKTAGTTPAEDVTSFPLNVFFNSKVRLRRTGPVRPFLGAGIGVLTSVNTFADHYGWDKFGAFQAMAGLALGVGKDASFQIALRVLTASQSGFGTKLMLAAGVSY